MSNQAFSLAPASSPSLSFLCSSPPPVVQRALDAARLEAVHQGATVRRLEGEVEAGQKRIRGLTDDLEDARAPYVADQGEQVLGFAGGRAGWREPWTA